jgi:hypothetical protein
MGYWIRPRNFGMGAWHRFVYCVRIHGWLLWVVCLARLHGRRLVPISGKELWYYLRVIKGGKAYADNLFNVLGDLAFRTWGSKSYCLAYRESGHALMYHLV